MATTSLYPLSSKEELLEMFVGRSIKDVPTPAAVLDLSKVRSNCSQMLEACETLDFGWRAHIKTHKTTELTRLQVGDGIGPVRICVSTIAEAEHIVPLLLEYKSAGRLALIAKALGSRGLSLMIDNPAQIQSIVEIYQISGIALDIFLKIDVGYKRAGVPPNSFTFSTLITSLLDLTSSGTAHLLGLYAHAGQSYHGSSPAAALSCLNYEFSILHSTAETIHAAAPETALVISVGATPQASAIRNLLIPYSLEPSSDEFKAISELRTTLKSIRDTNSTIEIHAGVYTVFDLQQLSTNAIPSTGPHAMITWDDLALTVVVEIASVYPRRGSNKTTEYLAAAGCLALGREPCKAYDGWGVLTPWNRPGVSMPAGAPDEFEGWIFGRVSQEHGTVTWKSRTTAPETLEWKEEGSFEVGQKIRVWPNHACIAGAGFGWYLVVDSSVEGREDEVIDVWPRWRGW